MALYTVIAYNPSVDTDVTLTDLSATVVAFGTEVVLSDSFSPKDLRDSSDLDTAIGAATLKIRHEAGGSDLSIVAARAYLKNMDNRVDKFMRRADFIAPKGLVNHTFSTNGNLKKGYLKYGHVFSNTQGIRLKRDAKLIGLTVNFHTSSDGSIRIRKNGTATNIHTATVNAEGYGEEIDVSGFSAGDLVQVYVEANTGRMYKPSVNLDFEYI